MWGGKGRIGVSFFGVSLFWFLISPLFCYLSIMVILSCSFFGFLRDRKEKRGEK